MLVALGSSSPSLRSGGGRIDATGKWLVGAKGEYPLHRPYLPISAVVDAVMRSNRNVGDNVVEGSGTWSVIPCG